MKAVSPNRVAIESFPIPEIEGSIQRSEKSREAEMKKQNRGTVFLAGEKCVFVKSGDVVSYYRNAATTVKDEDGKEYEIVDEAHILVKY